MDGSSEAYRNCVKENSELRALVGVLVGCLQREMLESSDASCASRLDPVLARAVAAIAARPSNSPRRRGNTDPQSVERSVSPGAPAELPAKIETTLKKPLPVVPVRLAVLSPAPCVAVPAPEPRPSRIVPGASSTLGRRAPAPAPRAANTSPRARVVSPRSAALEKLPPTLLGALLAKLPAQSVGALACCSSALRDAVAKWHRIAKRTNVVLEIVSSEQRYLSMLAEALKYKGVLVARGLMSSKDADVCFNGLPVMIHVSKKLIGLLKRKLLTWDEASEVGDVFVGMMKELRVYKGYAMSFGGVNQLLGRLFASSEGKLFLDRPHFSRLGRLDALLVAPVQRLPRFSLLLKECLRHTPESHSDASKIRIAINGLKDVSLELETAMSGLVSDSSALELINQIVGTPSNVLEGRVLKPIKSGDVTLLLNQKMLPGKMILFPDFLLVAYSAAEQWKFLLSVAVNDSMLSVHFDEGRQDSFLMSISSRSLGSSATVLIAAPSESEQRVWLASFKRQSLEAAVRRHEDTSCFAVAPKLARLASLASVSTSAASLSSQGQSSSSVLKSGTVEKRHQKRFLVASSSGLAYFVRQNGEQRGFIAAGDILACSCVGSQFEVQTTSKVLVFTANSEHEAQAWREIIASLIETAARRNTVHLLFDDGSRAVVEIGAGETIRGLVERICAKRGLDAGACGLFEGGAIVARSAPAASLRGRTLRLGSDSPPPLPPLLPASSGSTSPRGPLVKQRSVPTIPVNEIDAAQTRKVNSSSAEPSSMLVRVEMPSGSMFKYFTVSLVSPTAGQVLAALAQKKVLSSDERECFLFDMKRGVPLDSNDRIEACQALRLNYSSSETDSAILTDDIFETNAMEVGSLYVGSVTTGTRGLSPMRKATAK